MRRARAPAARTIPAPVYSSGRPSRRPDELRQAFMQAGQVRASLAPLSAPRLIKRVARFRVDDVASPAEASRFALRQLGRHVRAIDVQIEELNDRLTSLVSDCAPELLALQGVGVDVAGNLLVA